MQVSMYFIFYQSIIYHVLCPHHTYMHYFIIQKLKEDSILNVDKGTGAPSLSLDIGTMGQAQNLAKGRDGPGQPVKSWDGTWAETIGATYALSFS